MNRFGVSLVSVWICEGGPSSPWEQPGWAKHYCVHGAGSHLALEGALRETQAGANLQKTLPACLIMRMTCSSIPWLCVRAATVFLWSCDTFRNITCYTYSTVFLVYAAITVMCNSECENDMMKCTISKTTGCVIFREVKFCAALCLIPNLQSHIVNIFHIIYSVISSLMK